MMLPSVMNALSNRFDSQFLIGFWLPACVAFLGGIGLLATRVGMDQIGAWVQALNAVQQTLCLVIVLLGITLLAFLLQALRLPVVELYAGATLPRVVAGWSTAGQRRAKRKAANRLKGSPDHPLSTQALWQNTLIVNQYYPQRDADLKPTLLGNVFAAAAEHPRFAFAMDGTVWWPRLSPLLPGGFVASLSGAQAPMMALLNLSVVFAILALAGGALLGLSGLLWPHAIVVLAGGLILCRLCYLGALGQAAELGRQVRVAFDLYRQDILAQLGVPTPPDMAAERALWVTLTDQLCLVPEDVAALTADRVAAEGEAPAGTAQLATTPHGE